MAATEPSKLLTPKELADAIGASESSLRRWVDSGRVKMSRTAGGHRRIRVEEAIRFIRESGSPVVRPAILGLPINAHVTPALAGVPETDMLFSALAGGHRGVARSLVIGWFLDGRPSASIFDGPMADSLHRLGEIWEHDRRGILIEHRATEMCVEIIAELKRLLPQPADDAPVSLGGAPQSDVYTVPTMMVGAVLMEAGYRDINFGPNTPISLLADAAHEHHARLVWLSLSVKATGGMKQDIVRLANRLRQLGSTLVLGGREISAVVPDQPPENALVMGSMMELAKHVKQLSSSATAGAP